MSDSRREALFASGTEAAQSGTGIVHAGASQRRMKLLLYGINFAPEMTGIGKYTGEMAQWLGFLLVGALVALVGWLMLAQARKNLTAGNLKPTKTIDSLRANRRWAEGKIHAAHEPAP